jgi:glycerate kinase
MTAQEVADTIASNLPPHIKSKTILLADGGEGSLNTIATKLKGKMIKCNVHNPVFR